MCQASRGPTQGFLHLVFVIKELVYIKVGHKAPTFMSDYPKIEVEAQPQKEGRRGERRRGKEGRKPKEGKGEVKAGK